MFRAPRPAPASRVPEGRRGAVQGRFCHGCGGVYPTQRKEHSRDPIHGKDHIASPCSYEGSAFEPGADWWEPAVEVLPAPPKDEGEGEGETRDGGENESEA